VELIEDLRTVMSYRIGERVKAIGTADAPGLRPLDRPGTRDRHCEGRRLRSH